MAMMLGAVLGSFACCQVWRMRYRQKGKKLGKWSVCLSCGHKLSVMENVPILSWLILRGKCKKCGQKIGMMEILAEVGLMVIFGLIMWRSYDVLMSGEWLEIGKIIVLSLALVGMWMLLLYDARWGEMPDGVLWFTIVMSVVYRVMVGVEEQFSLGYVTGLLLAILILPALYLVLYRLSRETLVGGGDWLLCLAIALFLGDGWLALIELCAANMIAALWGMPGLIKKKEHRLHFAPFLVISFVVIWLLRDVLSGLISF